MLRKIFHVTGSKRSQETATIVLHIVFEDQYHIYEASDPFGNLRKSKSKNHKASNKDLISVTDQNYKRDETKNIKHITPIKTLPVHLIENSISNDQGSLPKSTKNKNIGQVKIDPRRHSNDNAREYDSRKFVFIKVKNQHQYDLNPKLIKFFLAEMLKDQNNRAKLAQMNK